ncbi:uncharacterized [Tachysurus ichikawai]
MLLNPPLILGVQSSCHTAWRLYPDMMNTTWDESLLPLKRTLCAYEKSPEATITVLTRASIPEVKDPQTQHRLASRFRTLVVENQQSFTLQCKH